jgi:SAM-dependent methyltransferase
MTITAKLPFGFPFFLPAVYLVLFNISCSLQVQTVLDIGCGFGSFGAHLVSLKLMSVCIAAYEATGSQVQMALERGLPAMIGNFISRQLPYPSLSFDMIHCAQCGIVWDKKGI